MIKLKCILLEGNYKKEISLTEAIDIFKTNNKTYTEKRGFIYRGMRAIDSYYFAQPSLSSRKSANTTNYYTTLTGNSPDWKNYPKRSASIICTSDKHTAKTYSRGTAFFYYVFPKDGSRVGVCPDSDIWWSFKKTLNGADLETLNSYMDKIFIVYHQLTKSNLPIEEYQSNYNEMVKVFSFIDNNTDEFAQGVKNYYDNHIFSRWYQDEKLRKMKFLDYINYLLNPKQNGFEVKIYDSSFRIDSDDYGHELWTDGDSLLIKSDIVNDFGDAVGIQIL